MSHAFAFFFGRRSALLARVSSLWSLSAASAAVAVAAATVDKSVNRFFMSVLSASVLVVEEVVVEEVSEGESDEERLVCLRRRLARCGRAVGSTAAVAAAVVVTVTAASAMTTMAAALVGSPKLSTAA